MHVTPAPPDLDFPPSSVSAWASPLPCLWSVEEAQKGLGDAALRGQHGRQIIDCNADETLLTLYASFTVHVAVVNLSPTARRPFQQFETALPACILPHRALPPVTDCPCLQVSLDMECILESLTERPRQFHDCCAAVSLPLVDEMLRVLPRDPALVLSASPVVLQLPRKATC